MFGVAHPERGGYGKERRSPVVGSLVVSASAMAFATPSSFFAREVPEVEPNVAAMARALGCGSGLFVWTGSVRGALHPDDVRYSYLGVDPVEVHEGLVPPEMAPGRTDDSGAPGTLGWNGAPAAPRWVGIVPYECLRGQERKAWLPAPDLRPRPYFHRPLWRRYDAVVRVDHQLGRVVIEGDTEAAVARLRNRLHGGRLSGAGVYSLVPSHPLQGEADEAAHRQRVRRVLEWIGRGDVYQVNLARRLRFQCQGDRLALFFALRRKAPAPYGFFADVEGATVVASSPELALEVRARWLRTAPIKGTAPRGGDHDEDSELARRLDANPKERAELTMAVDLHRNDLGRVASWGGVRVPGPARVVAGRTVWSRVAEVVAQRRETATLEDIFQAVLPCGSVTGAPKTRAMELIATLEPHRRGLYTGVFGYVGRDRSAVLAMAIRTLEVEPCGRTHYGSGGGIVADSDPDREVDETNWKARQLEALWRAREGKTELVCSLPRI